jgi:hypothetical protein
VSKILDSAVDIQELGQSNLWVIYGKSNTGKTLLGATFPKPMLYVQLGDDGSNTIAKVKGIKALRISNISDLKKLAEELLKDKKYKSVFVDTFGLVVTEWTSQNVLSKGKRMTQQNWGDLKNETEELIKAWAKVAQNHIVILSCHESMDTIEGMEDEIAPDGRPSVSKGARTYLEGMANYGIHTIRISKEVEKKGKTITKVKYACDIGPNPYYWTKLQIDPRIKIPDRVINPSYESLMAIIDPVEEQ